MAYYQMQDGSEDLVNSLNLIPCETNHFHGIGHGFEIGVVIDGRLETEKTKDVASTVVCRVFC